jgi:predicted ATPase
MAMLVPNDPLVSGPPEIARLEQAVGLCRGPFLEGLSLPDAAAFEEWVTRWREHLGRALLEALMRLAELYLAGGEAERAQGAARRAVEMDPLSEAAHRALMRALTQGGQRSAALAQYDHCRQVLRAELGVAPEAETVALAEAIREGVGVGRIRARETEPSSDAVAEAGEAEMEPENAPPRPLFVAREQELARLEGWLDEALAGRGRVGFVMGEPGSGKTLLLREFARRAMAEHDNLVAAIGRCNAYTGIGDPYLAFREILAQLGGDVEQGQAASVLGHEGAQRLERLLPQSDRALAEVGPDLVGVMVDGEALLRHAERVTLPGAPWLEALRDLAERSMRLELRDTQQVALFQQYTAVVQRLARGHPLLLILEDLHWADAGSISLLFHLASRLESERVLLLGAYRETDLALGRRAAFALGAVGSVEERHPLEPVLHELRRRYGEMTVDLGQADGRRFVEQIVDAEPNVLAAEFREALYRQGGGNALFTTELLSSLRERGDLEPDGQGRWRAGKTLRWDRLPARVEAVIADRTGRLPQTLQMALKVGSVEGDTFSAEVVAQVVGTEPGGLVLSLSQDAARRHGLVVGAGLRRLGDGRTLSVFRFQHILIQKYLYDDLDVTERAYLHGAIADALVGLYGQENDEVAAQLARHYEQAGDIARAIEHLRLAAARATRLRADREAADHLARALAMLRMCSISPDRDRLELTLLTALANRLQVVAEPAAPSLRQVCDRARELRARVNDTSLVLQSLFPSIIFMGLRDSWSSALELCQENIGSSEQRPGAVLAATLRSYRAWVLFCLGRLSQAEMEFRLAVTLLDALPDAERESSAAAGEQMRAQTWLANTLAILGYPDQAMACRQKALDLADRLGNPPLSAITWNFAGALPALLLGRYDLALSAARQAQSISEERGYSDYGKISLLMLGWAEQGLGQPREAISHLRQAIDALRRNFCHGHLSGFVVSLALAHSQIGETEEGLRLLTEMREICDRMDEHWSEAELHRLRGELLLQRGDDPEEVEASYREAIAVAQRQEARSWELRATTSLARLLRDRGRTVEAREQLGAIYGWFTEGVDTPDLVEARALLEELDWLLAGAVAPEPPRPLFVAREQELARLDAWLGDALAGRGRVGFVMGEPGSGKTLLMREFARRVMERHADLLVTGGNCNAYGGLGDAYLPFVEAFRLLVGDVEAQRSAGALGWEHARRLREAAPATIERVLQEGPALLDTLVSGAALLRLARTMPNGAAWEARVQAALDHRMAAPTPTYLHDQITRLLQGMARPHPLVLMLDDLQWADTATISLLFHLARRLAGQRLLVLGAYRPGEVAAGRDGAAHPLQEVLHELQAQSGDITLDLAQAEGRAFVRALVDSDPHRLDDGFCDALYRHTDGHALFTVELLRGLRQRGDLVRDGQGRWVQGPTLDWERLPERVEAVITAQMARLPAQQRELLTVASIEGEEFHAEVAARVLHRDEGEVIAALSGLLSQEQRLVTAQSLRWVGTQRFSRYRFRHYMFQHHLYQRLDPVRRAYLHGELVRTLEDLGAMGSGVPDQTDTTENLSDNYVDLLGTPEGIVSEAQAAWHWEQAGLVEKAALYHGRAVRALSNLAYSFDTALGHSRKQVELLARLPPSPERMRYEQLAFGGLAWSLAVTQGWRSPDVIAAMERSLELAIATGDRYIVADAHAWMGSFFYLLRGELDKAVAHAEQSIVLGQGGPAPWVMWANTGLATILEYRGEFVRSVSLFKPLAESLERTGTILPLANCLDRLAVMPWGWWCLGYPDQALRYGRLALEMIQREPDKFQGGSDTRVICNAICCTRQLCGDVAGVAQGMKWLQRLLAEGRCPPTNLTDVTFYEGWVYTRTGQLERGIAELYEAVEPGAKDPYLKRPLWRCYLAEALARAGRLDEGLDVLAEALAQVAATGERFAEAELHRLRGELLLHRGDDPEEVEASYREAIAVAQRQEARSWELRATTSLARLLRDRGRTVEAREQLGAIYGWFTEGFDTPDLVEARALLEELGGAT